MRWSVVRLIFHRELIDQLRDRRTLFMIVVLPVLIYPLAGFGLMQLAVGIQKKEHVVAVVGADQLPAPAAMGPRPWPALLTPAGQPPLRLIPHADEVADDAATLVPRRASSLEEARALLDERQVDLILVVDEDFLGRLDAGRQPVLTLYGRPGEERSRLAEVKATRVLAAYRGTLKQTRLLRAGLPADFDEVFVLTNPDRPPVAASRGVDDLFRVLGQIFPFVLVMWSLAGALYPAVDLCAGEKERGTMETLLISPASREEIVWGKFLTIWLFSAATALLNLVSMSLSVWYYTLRLPQNPFEPTILLWGTILLLPLSAFFSAVSLAIGVYARSTKEGQYYLMPLFLVTMPLVFLTLAPGVELNGFYSMVPVTGVSLLLKDLVTAGKPPLTLATYFLPVLAPMVIYSWLALRWAIEQFQREEVLFREAERFDVGLWFQSLFREKEPLPGTSMAFGCFALVTVLFQLAMRLSVQPDVVVHLMVAYLACVLTPTLMIAVVLTTRPLAGLLLRPAGWGDLLRAVAFAGLLFVPGVLAAHFLLESVPGLKEGVLEQVEHPAGPAGPSVVWLAVLLVVTCVCEELTFRGLILTGLSRYFRPVTALFLSSFLFALFHMNVFQAVPHFLLGLLLGLLAQRTGSLLPAIVLHLGYNALVIAGLGLPQESFAYLAGESGLPTPFGWLSAGVCLIGVVGLALPLLRRPVQVPPPVT